MEVETEGEVVTGLTSNPIKDRPPRLTTGPADGSPPRWHISAPLLPAVPSSLASALTRVLPQKGRCSVSQHIGETISPISHFGD